jgi:hypothetical protein
MVGQMGETEQISPALQHFLVVGGLVIFQVLVSMLTGGALKDLPPY